MKQKSFVLSLALVLGAGLSCDQNPMEPPTTGGISIVLLSPSGSAFAASAADATSDLQPMDARASVALDQVRVTVTGPTSKTVTSSTPTGGNFTLTADGLAPGSYIVRVEGLVGGQVAHFGVSGSVTVTAGQNATASVSFPVFQPQVADLSVVDTLDVLRFTVSYPAVTNATGYIVEWSQSPTMAGASSMAVTGTSTEVTVTEEGQYYFTVKAVNPAVASGGLASVPKSVFVFQGVATVAVTPPTPVIAAGSTQQLSAEARDADNNVVPNITWFWASSNHAVATVDQTGLVTGVNGGQATISAIAKGTPGSATVGVTALPGVRLTFTIQPGNTTAGQTIPSLQVGVLNLHGQVASADNVTQVTVAIGTNAGPDGVLTGLQTVSVVSGVANFNNLAIAKAGSGYTLTASAAGFGTTTSSLFNVNPGAATQLAFTVQPTNAPASAPLSPAVQVSVQDALGNRVTSASNAVTVSIANNPGSGTLNGTKVVNAINGVASFSGLSIDQGGAGYTLGAASGSLTAATSTPFDIASGAAASKLTFTIQPTSSIAGDAMSPAIQVEIQDASGNRITSSRDPVTIAIATNPSIGGAGTLIGTKIVNAIDGVASFTGVSIQKTGPGYTLLATSGSLAQAISGGFDVTAGAAAKLAFSTQPTNVQGNVAIAPAVSVTITDMFDNATSATNSVTLALGDNQWKTPFSPGATLSGSTLTAAAFGGVATFGDVRVDKPAPSYSLLASATSLSGATSSAFNTNLTLSQFSAGNSHTCALSIGGAYCFGSNGSGQLGAFLTAGGRDSIAALVRGGLSFVTVSAGGNHSCGLTAAGAAYCWGNNGNGQLGNNSTTASPVPVAVAGGHVFASIDAGGSHTCGITTSNGAVAAEDEQVYCWGYNGIGQVGDGQAVGATFQYLTPLRVVEPLQTVRATQVSAGINHTCVRANDTNAYCWGYNYYGQLGNNTVLTGGGQGTSTATPSLVAGGLTWVSISAGAIHTCGITFVHASSQPVYCFGYNGSGQLGDGTNANTSVPVETSDLNWTGVSAGGDHSCALLAGGSAYCWGYNGLGALGDEATPNDVNTPVAVNGGLTFLKIEVGANHSCGRTSSLLYCWGYNGNGQLGMPGTGAIKRTPTAIIQ